MPPLVNPYSNDPNAGSAYELGYDVGYANPQIDEDPPPFAPELRDIFYEGREAGRAQAYQDAPPPPPGYGRTSAGEARLPAALAIIAAFRANPNPGDQWKWLDRANVADDIQRLVGFPDTAQQGGNGLCAVAAFVNIWAQDAPDSYALFACGIYDFGVAYLGPAGGLRVTASPALRQMDYFAVVQHMVERHHPFPSQGDWMVFSAIRDSSNLFVDFTGDPDDWVSHALGDGSYMSEVVGWMRSAGAWTAVEESGTSLADAKGLDPSRSRCILAIDSSLINADPGGHTVVLRGPIIENSDMTVSLTLWTWTYVRPFLVARGAFEDMYDGAVVGYF